MRLQPAMKPVLSGGGAHGGGGRLRGAGARVFGGAGAWLWARTEANGQRKKRASHFNSWDLPDAQRFHHGPPFKNCDDFGNMRTVFDYCAG
jgi:hypothetical protein